MTIPKFILKNNYETLLVFPLTASPNQRLERSHICWHLSHIASWKRRKKSLDSPNQRLARTVAATPYSVHNSFNSGDVSATMTRNIAAKSLYSRAISKTNNATSGVGLFQHVVVSVPSFNYGDVPATKPCNIVTKSPYSSAASKTNNATSRVGLFQHVVASVPEKFYPHATIAFSADVASSYSEVNTLNIGVVCIRGSSAGYIDSRHQRQMNTTEYKVTSTGCCTPASQQVCFTANNPPSQRPCDKSVPTSDKLLHADNVIDLELQTEELDDSKVTNESSMRTDDPAVHFESTLKPEELIY